MMVQQVAHMSMFRPNVPVLQYRWVLFRISSTGKEVVIETAAEPSSGWSDFVQAVPSDEPRYGGTSSVCPCR